MRRAPSGFSLIELLIAVGLGMLSILAVGSVFMYGSRNYKQDDRTQRMQDELRFGMAQLSQDLEMVGFWAQVRDPVNDVDLDGTATVAGTNDCGPTIDNNYPATGGASGNNWTFRERRTALSTLGNVTTGVAAAGTFPCIDPAEFYADPNGFGTDIIGIKRLGGSVVTTQVANTFYLRTNGILTIVYNSGSAGTYVPASLTGADGETYEYKPVVWYVRKYATANQSPQIPSLCRKVLTTGGMADDPSGCVAQGIESMQLEFGFDGNGDGVPDYYTEYNTAPSVNTLASVIAMRVHLLARSTDPSADPTYKNTKSYALAGVTIGPLNDKYYRKSISTVVLLRNQSNRLAPYALPQ